MGKGCTRAIRFRRLTLRSATGSPQRGVPTCQIAGAGRQRNMQTANYSVSAFQLSVFVRHPSSGLRTPSPGFCMTWV